MEIKNDMRQLTSVQTALFLIGGVLMVVGMGLFVFLFKQLWGGCIYLAGAVIFAVLQCMQSYVGRDMTLRRLKSIQNLSDLFFILAGVLMVDTATNFLAPMFSNWVSYVEIIYNKWIIPLLVAVVLEVYTTHRITHELKKHEKNAE